MVVKIDMDMPKSCKECRFSMYVAYPRQETFCSALMSYFKEPKYDEYKKWENCPLKECK